MWVYERRTKDEIWKDIENWVSFNKGILISNISDYKNIDSRIKVKCRKGHDAWAPSAAALLAKRWCRKCAYEKNKRTLKNVQRKSNSEMFKTLDKYIKDKGGKLLMCEADYVSNKSPLKLVCDKGHDFESTFINLVNKKGWCKECADDKHRGSAKTYERLMKILSDRNWILISAPKKISSKSTVSIACDRGHIRDYLVNSITNYGNKCGICNKLNRGERIVRGWLSYLLKKKFVNTRPNWNINPYTEKKLELDCYNEELKIALEYDGAQHKKAINYYGGVDTVMKTLLRDAIKEDNCFEQGVSLIRIVDKQEYLYSFEDFFRYFHNECKKQGLEIVIQLDDISNLKRIFSKIHAIRSAKPKKKIKKIKQGKVADKNKGKKDASWLKLNNICANNNIKIKSTTRESYVNVHKQIEFVCSCGEEFLKKPGDMFYGNKIHCKKCCSLKKNNKHLQFNFFSSQNININNNFGEKNALPLEKTQT